LIAEEDGSTNRAGAREDLVFLLSFLQLNTLRFDKYFDKLQDALDHESRGEPATLADTTKECLKHVVRMQKNLQDILRLLSDSESKG